MIIRPMSSQAARTFLDHQNVNREQIPQGKKIEFTLSENKIRESIANSPGNASAAPVEDFPARFAAEAYAKLIETIKKREAEYDPADDAPLCDHESRGQERQTMVIYSDTGVKGCISESGIATNCDWIVNGLWQRADMDQDRFVQLLEENGYTVKTYANGQGPVYADVFEQMFGYDYDAIPH